MNKKTMITGSYHIKPGQEHQFVLAWNSHVQSLAYHLAAEMVSLYYNKDKDEYFSVIIFGSTEMAERFLHHEELKSATNLLKPYCLVPPTRQMLDVLFQAAA